MTAGGAVSKSADQFGRSRGLATTERDLRVLSKVGHHYGATYQVLSYWLSDRRLSESGVRQQVQRWIRLGLVSKHQRLGCMWVTLTRRGYDFVGQRYSLWTMPASRLLHTETVAAVRIWFEESPSRVDRKGEWTTERQLYARRGRFGASEWHVPDAELRRPGSETATSLEVELHLKRPRSRYVSEVFDRLADDVHEVRYFGPENLVPLLRDNITWAVKASGRRDVSVAVVKLPALAQAVLERGVS